MGLVGTLLWPRKVSSFGSLEFLMSTQFSSYLFPSLFFQLAFCKINYIRQKLNEVLSPSGWKKGRDESKCKTFWISSGRLIRIKLFTLINFCFIFLGRKSTTPQFLSFLLIELFNFFWNANERKNFLIQKIFSTSWLRIFMSSRRLKG